MYFSSLFVNDLLRPRGATRTEYIFARLVDMESIFMAAGNEPGFVKLLEACFTGREEHHRASGLHSGTDWSFGSHAAAFGLRPALCLVLG